MDTSQLGRELHHHAYWRGRLLQEFPEADEETLRDTLEGLTNLSEMLASVVRSYLDDLTQAAALGIRMSDMQERLARFEARADKKRLLVTAAMEHASLKKLTEPDFTVSLRPTPAPIVIVDEGQIPQTWWTPQPPKLDRYGLASALRAGEVIQGATLGATRATISVRTK